MNTKKYKIIFNEDELCKFNIIENETIRSNCMSIYFYLLKLNNKKNEELKEAGAEHLKCTTKFAISYRKFLKQYIRNHEKISLPTLKNRIDQLIKIGLLAVEKIKNSFVYSFHRFTTNEKVNELPNNIKPIEPIENTPLANGGDLPKYQNPKGIKDLDSNNCTPIVDNFDYNQYIQEQEKCDSWDFVSDKIEKVFSLMKVKSQWIKGQVIDRISKSYTNITKKYCIAYICSAVHSARNQSKSNYYKYVMADKYNNNHNNSTGTFNNCMQRDYSSKQLRNIEYALLGWEQ